MNRIRALRILAFVSSVLAYLQATLGGIVRVSGSGEGCRGWPLCSGHPYPNPNIHSVVEFSHRTNGSLLGLAVLATFLLVWFQFRDQRRLLVLAAIALGLVVFEGAVGGTVVLAQLQGLLVMFHFGMALVILGVLLTLAFSVPHREGAVREVQNRRLIDVTAALTFVLLLTGSSVTATSADDSCLAWPLCGNGFGINLSGVIALNYLHRGLVLVIGLLILHATTSTLRKAGGMPVLRMAAAVAAAAVVIQVVDGAAFTLSHGMAVFAALHVALATLVWAAVISVAILSRPPPVREFAARSLVLQGRAS